MIVAIHQPHYLPWLRYVHKLASCDVFVLLDDTQYEKNGWQNRNKIKGPNGPILLTVPVRNASFKPILAVEIDNQTRWADKHWKSLVQCYGKAPHFRAYAPLFERILAGQWSRLVEVNLALLDVLRRAMGIKTEVVRSSELSVPGHGTARLVEICRRLGAREYLTGDYAAANHLDRAAFDDAGISVRLQAWSCPTYRQQFASLGFLPDLSVVDLLFNEGPVSLQVLLRSREPVPAGPAGQPPRTAGLLPLGANRCL